MEVGIQSHYWLIFIHARSATYMDAGVERIVDQVVNPKIRSLVEPEVKRIINAYLGAEEIMDDEGEFSIPEKTAPHSFFILLIPSNY